MRAAPSALALCVLACASGARAEAPVFATGGLPVPVDGVRPASLPGFVTAPSAPVALHFSRVISPADVTDVLATATRVLDVYQRTLHLPPPLPDGARGGSPALDLYLVPSGPAATATLDALDATGPWDRASAFVSVRDDLHGDALVRPLAEAIAQALLYGIDARETDAVRTALAATFAMRAFDLPPDPVATAAFQRDPGDAVLARRDEGSARGAAMFFRHLAARYDRDDLTLLRGLAWMPVARTDASQWKLWEVPDVFDVLGRLVRDEFGGRDGVMLDFAVARFLAGGIGDRERLSGAAGDHAPSLRTLTLRDLPEWVVPPVPLEETGSASVTVDFSTPNALPTPHHLDVWFHGVHARRWVVTVVRLDASGHDVGHAPPVPVIDGEWSVGMEMGPDVVRAMVVVCDLGNGVLDPSESPDRNGLFALNLAGH